MNDEFKPKEFFVDVFMLIVKHSPTEDYETFGGKFTEVVKILIQPVAETNSSSDG